MREGEGELGVGKSTVQRALAELTERGFIVPVKRGVIIRWRTRYLESP